MVVMQAWAAYSEGQLQQELDCRNCCNRKEPEQPWQVIPASRVEVTWVVVADHDSWHNPKLEKQLA